MFESFIGFVFENYGVVGVATLLSVIGLVKWSGFFIAVLKKINPFKKNSNYVPRDILLSKLTYWLDFKIDNINIKDTGRREIFKDLLKYKFVSVKDNIFKLEKNEGFDSWDSSRFYNEILRCISDNIHNYESESAMAGIPPIVITKFKVWHSGTLEFLLKSSELISASNVYKNNHERIQAIYTVYTAMLEILINEAEKTLTDLNGELTGTVYKGVTCG